MCAWGEAYVLGPNINKPMDPGDVPAAWEASRRAVSLAGEASPVERALIEAMAERYAEAPVPNRAPLDLAYANAMRQVALDYPDDLDVQTLFAESLMDTMPWDYYVDPSTANTSYIDVGASIDMSPSAEERTRRAAWHRASRAWARSESPWMIRCS